MLVTVMLTSVVHFLLAQHLKGSLLAKEMECETMAVKVQVCTCTLYHEVA